jgi:hypothetical protein
MVIQLEKTHMHRQIPGTCNTSKNSSINNNNINIINDNSINTYHHRFPTCCHSPAVALLICCRSLIRMLSHHPTRHADLPRFRLQYMNLNVIFLPLYIYSQKVIVCSPFIHSFF